jgi:hypothetical protein
MPPLTSLLNQLKNATGQEQRTLFIHYCTQLIQLKEEGALTEEEAAYKIVSVIQYDNLTESPECDAIFDCALRAETPRTSSYAQPIGAWDSKTADQIKQKEWKELVDAVKRAQKQ